MDPYLATGSFNGTPPIKRISSTDLLVVPVVVLSVEALGTTTSPSLSKMTICPAFAVFCFSAGPNTASPLIIYANELYSFEIGCTTLAPDLIVKCR